VPTTTVREYQTQFESLANRIVGLPPSFYLSCFISGLKPEIRREVQAFQPISLSQAIRLAKLQEEKFANSALLNHPQRFAPGIAKSFITTDFNPLPSSKTPTPLLPNTTFLHKTSPNTNPPPIKRLSPAELQNRRENGLCYYFDDKYKLGYKCKKQFLLLIAEPENTDEHLTKPTRMTHPITCQPKSI